MSYILEALKKSQAERQLGSAPGLHAVPVGAPVRESAAVRRRPLTIALCAIAVAAALATGAWHFKSTEKKTATPPPPAAVHVATPAPAPVAVVAAVVAEPAPPPLAVVPPSAPVEKPPAARAAPAPLPVPVKVKVVTPPAPPPDVAEDLTVPTLRQLPEPIQRAVPPLVFSGYMYSSNSADRLVLIDKVLRHEGEEVAPGLMLEKLLPKAAVMNYRGYRYRVPF